MAPPSQVSGSCLSHGLELLGSANECTAASALLQYRGYSPVAGEESSFYCGSPMITSGLGASSCDNANRGPKCSGYGSITSGACSMSEPTTD